MTVTWFQQVPLILSFNLYFSIIQYYYQNSTCFLSKKKPVFVGNGDWLCCVVCSTSGRRVTSQINWPAVSRLPVNPCRIVNVVWYMGNMPRIIARYRPATSLLPMQLQLLLVVWIVLFSRKQAGFCACTTRRTAEYMQLVLIHRFSLVAVIGVVDFCGVLTSLLGQHQLRRWIKNVRNWIHKVNQFWYVLLVLYYPPATRPVLK